MFCVQCSSIFRIANKNTKKNNERGLTLVEIIVVHTILGIVMAWLASRLMGAGDRTKMQITELKMKSLQQALDTFQLRYNTYPSDLRALISCNEQTGGSCIPILGSDEELRDAWGTPFQYASAEGGRSYAIKSFGADRSSGGAGVNSDLEIKGP